MWCVRGSCGAVCSTSSAAFSQRRQARLSSFSVSVRSSGDNSSNYSYTNRNNRGELEENFFRDDFNEANGRVSEKGAKASSSSNYGASVGGWSSGGERERREEQEEQFGNSFGGWYSERDEARETSQSRQRGRGRASEYENQDTYEDGPSQASSSSASSSFSHSSLGLWPLRQEELLELFPLSGTPGQYSYYWGSWDEAVQRIGLSLLVTLLTTNSNTILAAGAFSYCVWGPIVQSMVRNLSVKKYPYGGFWEASILDLNFTNEIRGKGSKQQRRRRKQKQAEAFSYGYGNTNNSNMRYNNSSPPRAVNTTILRVGEVGLADVVVEIPYDISHETLRLGDPALLIVVSNSPSLNSFKAVRDIFLPETRQWLCEYPFVSRRGFKRIADRVSFMKSNPNPYGERMF